MTPRAAAPARDTPPVRRRRTRLRGAAVATGLVVASAPGVAVAVPAEGWPVAPEVPLLQLLTVIVFIPLGLVAILTFAVVAPSLAGSRREQGSSRDGHLPATWMGGPSKGLDSADAVDSDELADTDRGGAGARW